MRQYLLIIIFLLGAFGLRAQMHFNKDAFDFGVIAESAGVVKHSFTFTNKGAKPLVVLRVETSCTCTKADFSKKPIAAGANGTITITYDPKKQKGTFYKAIQIYSNAPEERKIVTIKGEVRVK